MSRDDAPTTGPPERTPDGHHLVIDGRKWRATDPDIPEARRDELTKILMAWRREVRRTKGTDDEAGSRAGVHASKVALGERGEPWWEQSADERRARWGVDVPAPDPPSRGSRVVPRAVADFAFGRVWQRYAGESPPAKTPDHGYLRRES